MNKIAVFLSRNVIARMEGIGDHTGRKNGNILGQVAIHSHGHLFGRNRRGFSFNFQRSLKIPGVNAAIGTATSRDGTRLAEHRLGSTAKLFLNGIPILLHLIAAIASAVVCNCQ
jgi:hypothetical protein